MSTGLTSKMVTLDDDFPQIDQNENAKAIEFFVILCGDVLLEVLSCGDRRRLTKLERIGRRFHWSVTKFFNEKPFLRLNLELRTWNKCQGYIVIKRNGLHYQHELTNLPQFLRFDHVKLDYHSTIKAQPIAEKCQSVVDYLQLLKLNDSNLIHFNGTIDENNRSDFSDYSQLFDHLRNEFLPICGSSRGYKFTIWFYSDSVSRADLLAKILQMPQIDCCSNVAIFLHNRTINPIYPQFQLMFEPISDWLHRNYNGIAGKSKERFLRIFPFNSLCAQELCNHLKKAFVGAEIRVCPYTLKLENSDFVEGTKEESEVMINKNTGEELLIVKKRMRYSDDYLIKIIKRGAQKKN